MPVSNDQFITGNQYSAVEAQAVAQAINGSGQLAPVRVATNTETLTITSGSVASITGTTIDGVTVANNDRVLIANAPASTGAAGGITLSSQPANGVYFVVSGATVGPLVMARVYEMGGSTVSNTVYNPSGWNATVCDGTVWPDQEFTVNAPSPSATMTYGTTAIQWQIQPNLTNAVIFANKQFTDPVFTANASPTYTAGKLVYDTGNDCLTFFSSDSNVSLQIGQETWLRVVNSTGSTIANGAAVYINGASAGLPTIALAKANAAATSHCVGLATESIANTNIGYVTAVGAVHSLNTSGFTAGVPVYLDATTAGNLNATAPVAPNFTQPVGWVAVSSATVGVIVVNPGGPTSAIVTASGKTLTVNNSIALTGTDSTTMTFPGTTDNVVCRTSTDTLTNKTLTAPTINTPTISSGSYTALSVQGYLELIQALGTATTSKTIATTFSNGSVVTCTLTNGDTCAFTLPAPVASWAMSFTLIVYQPATTGSGEYSFSTPSGSIFWPTAGAPNMTNGANAVDIITFVSDGTNWFGSYVQGY